MTVLERLRDRLAPLGMYRLDGTTRVDAELTAYAAALCWCEEQLLELYRESFSSTAESDTLDRLTDAMGLSTESLALRQAAVRELCSIREGDFNLAGMRRAARGAGLDGTVEEYPAQKLVVFAAKSPPEDKTWSARVLRRFLPAHLKGRIDGRDATWSILEAKNKTWSQWDAGNKTWKAFEETPETIDF